MRRLSILSLPAALLIAATAAVAGEGHRGEGRGHGGHGWHHKHHGGMIEKHLDELGLEADQKTKIEGILEAAKKDREADREEMRAAHRELRKLLEADSPDVAAVDAQVEKLGKLKTAKHKAMLHTLLDIRAELTPEQRKKMKELHEKAWKERKGKGHRDGDREPPAGSDG